eukprot:1192614-Prorocentrum_minimum.AAC.2
MGSSIGTGGVDDNIVRLVRDFVFPSISPNSNSRFPGGGNPFFPQPFPRYQFQPCRVLHERAVEVDVHFRGRDDPVAEHHVHPPVHLEGQPPVVQRHRLWRLGEGPLEFAQQLETVESLVRATRRCARSGLL